MQRAPTFESEPARPVAWAVLRAPQWLHFLALPLAAFDQGSRSSAAIASVVRGVVLAALALSYAYGLNAISDRRSDLDAAKNPLRGMEVVPQRVVLVVAGTGMAALLLALLAGRPVLYAVSASLAASTVYSVGPRLKVLPGIGTLLNVAIFAPILLFGVQPSRPAPAGLGLLLVTFAVLVLENQLLHERADAAEDAGASVRTTARALGEQATVRLVLGLGVLGASSVALFEGSQAERLCAALVCLLGCAPAWLRAPWVRRRRVHRWLALGGGAVLFAMGFFR
jgi:4-hydroxybenzoate polyprenyltransferase